jgi:hypothetical protein
MLVQPEIFSRYYLIMETPHITVIAYHVQISIVLTLGILHSVQIIIANLALLLGVLLGQSVKVLLLTLMDYNSKHV